MNSTKLAACPDRGYNDRHARLALAARRAAGFGPYGTELLFSWTRITLGVSIHGKPAGEIESAALCWALFDVYLGEKPITSDGKKTVIGRLPEILGR